MAVNIEIQVHQNLFGRISFLILTGITILFIPFFGLSSAIDPVLMPRFCVWGIVSFVLLVSFVIQLCIKPESVDCSIVRRLIFVTFLCYLLFSLISLIKTVNITEGIYEVLKTFLSIVYLFVATIILSKNKNYVFILAKAVIVAATILSLLGFYEYFRYGSCDITGTMANRALFSSALFLMLPFCLYGVLGFRNYWKVIGAIPMVLILTIILLNPTRSVWLGMFVSTIVTTIVVVLLRMLRKTDIPKGSKVSFFMSFLRIAAILIVSGMIFGYLYLRSNSIDSFVDRISSIFSPSDTRNTPRIAMWQKTLGPIKDNFFLGVGAGNWKIALPSYNLEGLPPDMFTTTFFVRPENDYVWVLSETGALGFIFYISLFAIVISYIIKIMIHSSSSDDKLLSILMFFGIAGYMVISFFWFLKERIFHLMFLLLIMAIVISIYHRISDYQKNVSRRFILALSIPSLILLVFVVINGYTRLNAEVHTKRALFAREAKNWRMVVSEIDKGYSVFAALDPTSTPLKWYRGEANFLLDNKQEALEDFKEAYKANPYHIYVLNNLATCYELQGNHAEAINYYNKALKICPLFEDALINLGATYYNSGTYKEAYETLLCCKSKTQNPKLEQYLRAVKEKLGGEK